MEKYPLLLSFVIALFSVILINAKNEQQQLSDDENWILVWKEDFNNNKLDTTVWSKIPRGKSAWNNTMSLDNRCFEFRNGCIVLKGIVNDNLKSDTSKYLTGGIYTKHKKAYKPGRIIVRAKLNGARGAWPAIWLVPFKTDKPWLWDGEIDIMERFHHKPYVLQTIHSLHTRDVDSKFPERLVKVPVDFKQFNEYGVDIEEDSIIFHVNGVKTLSYPKLSKDSEIPQFPFFHDWTLIIDMQLGGGQVGSINDSELPVEMEIDWIKHYIKS
ncbi:MAG: glycoside hydrolase family 16 protein [Lachnospiraceae bacterium]|nr:glycoside hydrolase family 16 protein [Lachnospiraceae bacterium]